MDVKIQYDKIKFPVRFIVDTLTGTSSPLKVPSN